MPEAFLHYIWNYQLFSIAHLATTEGDPIHVLDAGWHNPYSGPDFKEASLIVGSLRWSGSIEIHVFSKDWNNHKHQFDAAYNSVVLHVVWEQQEEAFTASGRELAVLELKDRVDLNRLHRWQQKGWHRQVLGCTSKLPLLSKAALEQWKYTLLTQRLKRQAKVYRRIYKHHHSSLKAVLYFSFFKAFGFKANSSGMELLFEQLPVALLCRLNRQPQKSLLVLFGVAGLLSIAIQKGLLPTDAKRCFARVKKEWSLHPLSAVVWAKGAVRPANSVATRLTQLAVLLANFNSVFKQFQMQEKMEVWVKLLHSLPLNMGKASIQSLIINVYLPVKYFHLMLINNRVQLPITMEAFRNFPAETNSLLQQWSKLGLQAKNAFEAQSYLEWAKECTFRKNCLNCPIGKQLLKPET